MSAVAALLKEVKELKQELASLKNTRDASNNDLCDKIKRQEDFIDDQSKRYKDMYEGMKGDVQTLMEQKAWWKQQYITLLERREVKVFGSVQSSRRERSRSPAASSSRG